jgi:hypothetical protein
VLKIIAAIFEGPAVPVEAHDRKRLEQLCLFIAGCALANVRVQTNGAGHVVLKLKTSLGEGQQLVVAAVAAAQAPEAVGQDAAFEEGVKLVFDELRQVCAGCVFGLSEERRGVLLHKAVQRGLFRAVAFAVDRGAIQRPLELPADGLHARLPKW